MKKLFFVMTESGCIGKESDLVKAVLTCFRYDGYGAEFLHWKYDVTYLCCSLKRMGSNQYEPSIDREWEIMPRWSFLTDKAEAKLEIAQKLLETTEYLHQTHKVWIDILEVKDSSIVSINGISIDQFLLGTDLEQIKSKYPLDI